MPVVPAFLRQGYFVHELAYFVLPPQWTQRFTKRDFRSPAFLRQM